MKRSKLMWVMSALLLCATMALFVSSCGTSETKLIPREVIFGNPEKASPQISPDGTMLAYLAPVNNVLNVWVRTIGAEDDKAVTKDVNRGIRNFFWAADSKHILYLQDVGGNENWRLYGVNLETDQIKDYTPFEDVQTRIVDRNKHFPNELLIAMNKENPQVHDVYRLDLTSGELKLVARNPGNIAGWLSDANFKVRGALAATPDGGFDLLLRENEKASWDKFIHWDSENTMASGPICFTKNGDSLYLLDSREVNAGRLIKMEIATKDFEVIAQDPQ